MYIFSKISISHLKCAKAGFDCISDHFVHSMDDHLTPITKQYNMLKIVYNLTGNSHRSYVLRFHKKKNTSVSKFCQKDGAALTGRKGGGGGNDFS